MRLSMMVTAMVALSSAAYAQKNDAPATLTGRVLDATDSGAVAWAEVQIVGTNLIARADGRGNFKLSGIPAKAREYSVRALGYAKLTQSEDFPAGGRLERDIYMMRVPRVLTQMTVHGRSMRVPRYFEMIYERGARGFGSFITREQIDSLNPFDLKTMLQTVAGVYTNERGVYFHKCMSGRPELWIDGQRATRFMKQSDNQHETDPWFFNQLLENVRPTNVQAMEIYPTRVSIPAEFEDNNPCAVIAIWSKRGT
jgi:hypothetical protein